MKKIISTIILTLAFLSPLFAQDDASLTFKLDESSGDYYYEEVVSAADIKQDELFKRAKTWVVANMQTADNNISADEKEFTIVNGGAIKLDDKWQHQFIMSFKFHVWLKDGKYKLRIDNINFLIHPIDGSANLIKSYADLDKYYMRKILREQANEKFTIFLGNFKKGMSSTNKNDW